MRRCLWFWAADGALIHSDARQQRRSGCCCGCGWMCECGSSCSMQHAAWRHPSACVHACLGMLQYGYQPCMRPATLDGRPVVKPGGMMPPATHRTAPHQPWQGPCIIRPRCVLLCAIAKGATAMQRTLYMHEAAPVAARLGPPHPTPRAAAYKCAACLLPSSGWVGHTLLA